MRLKNITSLLCGMMSIFIVTAQAGKPLWTFTPLTATTITVPSNSMAAVEYIITNQSNLTHTLTMKPIPGVTQLTDGVGICSTVFTLAGKSSCALSLQIKGAKIPPVILGGPAVCEQANPNQCYQPSAVNELHVTQSPDTSATLAASVSTLALSVNCPTPGGSCVYSNAALTGTPRTITIINSGLNPATGVTYSSTSLPAGTSISPASCGNIAPGASCQLTITPGQTASTTTATLSISGENTNILAPTLNILTYGSLYQGGIYFLWMIRHQQQQALAEKS